MTCAEIAELVLKSPVVAAFVVGTFGMASIWLGLGRFRSERWWEKKATAYASAIEGPHGIGDYAAAIMDAEEKHYEISDSWKAKLEKENKAGWFEVRKIATQGSFLITERAGAILTKAINDMEAQHDEQPSAEFYNARWKIADNCIRDFKQEAKRDLRT